MVWPLKLTAIGAFSRICSQEGIVGAAHVPAGPRDSILWDSHVSTSDQRARWPDRMGPGASASIRARKTKPDYYWFLRQVQVVSL
ncbi:MAG: hypothetical protein AAGF94_00240 [Pseudomonadota bacterium]